MRLPSVVENEIAEGAALMNADGKQTAVMVPVNDDSALLVSVEYASSMLGIGRHILSASSCLAPFPA